jgi:hypothetical protein
LLTVDVPTTETTVNGDTSEKSVKLEEVAVFSHGKKIVGTVRSKVLSRASGSWASLPCAVHGKNKKQRDLGKRLVKGIQPPECSALATFPTT